MAENSKQTKIPRFESGSSPVLTRIPKPALGVSKLARPQMLGTTTKKDVVSKQNINDGTVESNSYPRKSFIRRFGAANKVPIQTLPRLNQNPVKPPQLVFTQSDAQRVNQTIKLSKDTAVNANKPVIAKKITDAAMAGSLTRSNTFICDVIDDQQAKLLSVTHNITSPNQTETQMSVPPNKERTFKRSLSPIPGETMNAAKRKVMDMSDIQQDASAPVPMPKISTPRKSIDARKSNLTFFGGSDPHLDQKTFSLDNITFEQSNNFAPDAFKVGSTSRATNRSSRMFDLTQTIEKNGVLYPENCDMNQISDANAAEHEVKNADSTKLIISSNGTNDGDGNLTKTYATEKTQPIEIVGSGQLSELAKKRFSLGLDLPECTLDCSIELCDSSAATSAQDSSPLVNYNPHSYDMDESLGILTPDQMIEFLDTNASHAKLELPISLPVKILTHKCRIDQTPSPEDLPLDPIGVKTIDTSKEDLDVTLQPSHSDQDGPSQTDSDSKTDQMTKSTTSKASSFITSVTSIASLDNGYHADGEMSRPASRGAESPLRRVHNSRSQNKVHANEENVRVVRRQDPMTDSDFLSDFFTESDADDIFHRGDRRVQIIDGHMYNAQGADVSINEASPENEMESSGVYTDVDHRGDDDILLNARNEIENENESDMSPDGSTDTIKSSEYANENAKPMSKDDLHSKKQTQKQLAALPTQSNQSIAAMSSSSSTTINDSVATCVCEKPNANYSGDQAQLVINGALSNTNEKTSCKLHSVGRTDNDNRNISNKSATPQNKVNRFSPNRKQIKSDTSSGHSKRNDSVNKSETKSNGVRIRSSVISTSKKSPGTKSPSENAQRSVNCEINMTSDQSINQLSATVQVRKNTPNKWDAVMNKIALNKAEVKTVKYSEVKSKVTCGLKRASPNPSLLAHETASDSGNSSLTSTKSSASPTVTRQSSGGISKRNIVRDSSKDCSVNFGRDSTVSTPGKRIKPTTPNTRSSARKRSSIQNGCASNDIEIEPTAKPDSPTIKPVTMHKRLIANNKSPTTNVSPVSEKRAAINVSKKPSATNRLVSTVLISNKASNAKEHGLQTTQQIHPSTINNNNNSISNNNHSTKSSTNSSKLAASDNHDSFRAAIHRNGKSSAATMAVTVPQNIAKPSGKSFLVNDGLNENLIGFSIIDSTDGDRTINAPAVSTPIPNNETRNSNQRKPTLYDSNIIRANKSVVALSILIQHLTTSCGAFDTPSLRAALETAKDKLLETQSDLETMRTKCTYLEEQMIAKENFFTTHQLAVKESNERALDQIKISLRDAEKSAQEQIKVLQYELDGINQQHTDALKSYQMKSDLRISDLEMQLKISRDKELELVERLNSCTVTENQLRDKVQASEQEFSDRLIAATARERELNEKVAQLTRQIRADEDKRYRLEEKLKLACDETNVLRQRRNSGDFSTANSNLTLQNQSCNSSVMLEEEVLSLRTVLDMKLNEISDLRKHNQSMIQAQDELPKAQLKIQVLETRLEDLTIQLKTKSEDELELSMKNRSLQELFNQEVKNRTRLSLHNEELQWKLKLNSEKYTHTINELSKSYQDSSLLNDLKKSFCTPISESSQENSNETAIQLNSSPPSSPVVKGVVEKCDSVSYVLELNDEESAEDAANRVVKRAGSFRANFKERSTSFKRQLSLGPNLLSQSASATSLSRQHSDSPVKSIGGTNKLHKSSRTRSYSLSVNNEPKTANHLPSENTNSDYRKWHKSIRTMATSSPMASRFSQNNDHSNGPLETDDADINSDTRSNSISTDDVDVKLEQELLPSDLRSKLIVPRQDTVEKLKKRPQIKKSAGEAMVSQQSEDDQSFGSDIDSTEASPSSSSAASPSHSETSKNRNLSLDEELFMNKIVASLSTRSTPMEVSWSEDGDNEPYAQESSA